jgi:hypothetical protein
VRRGEDESVVDHDAGPVRRPRVAAADVDPDDRRRWVVRAARDGEQRDERAQERGAPQRSSFDIQIESSTS